MPFDFVQSVATVNASYQERTHEPVIEILIVDDDNKIAENLVEIFKHYGYHAVAVSSGVSAITLLKNLTVKLILLDLNMPEMNGYSVLQFISEHHIDTHVLILSGENNFEAARQSMRFGFVYDFIRKPYLVKDLLLFISRTQDIIRQKDEIRRQHQQLSKSEQMYRFFVEQSPHVLFLLNQDGEFCYVNTAVLQVLGYTQEELLDKHFSFLVFQEDLAQAEKLFQEDLFAAAKNPSLLRLHSKLADTYTYFEVSINPIDQIAISLIHLGSTVFDKKSILYGSIRAVQETKLTDTELLKFHHVMDNSPNLIFITNELGTIEYANHKICEITGYTALEVIGHNPRIFASGQTSTEEYQELWQCIQKGKVWRGVFKNRKKNGQIYWARQSIAPIFDDDGIITNYISIQEDVTEALEIAEQLSHQASHDALTHLINRHEFDRRLERVVATAQEGDLTHILCYLDLDNFKIINDSCSHAAGDELLRQISAQFAQLVRSRDTLARLGGDEFAILMEYCSLEQAQPTIKRIHGMIERFQFHWEGKTFRIGVSIGLVMINNTCSSPEVYLKQADLACYQAKATGQNQMHVFQSDSYVITEKKNTINWVSQINDALDNDLMCLYSQPIVVLDESKGKYCEILLRMKKNDGSIIVPSAFLPTAERYQLSAKIDRWVITNTFKFFTEHPEKLAELHLCSINLSSMSIHDASFIDFIDELFKKTGMPGHKVCFEITETVAIINLTRANQFINRLKTYGCKFSLDDFGSGFSSFAYLKNLAIDFLKIDGFFVKTIQHNKIDLAMVRSINEIAHVLGKKTIAKFVENKEILELLQNLDVDFVQGNYLGEPKQICYAEEY